MINLSTYIEFSHILDYAFIRLDCKVSSLMKSQTCDLGWGVSG